MATGADKDQQLVERLRGGEKGAVEELVDRYGARIHRVTRRLLNDPRDAEEVRSALERAITRLPEEYRAVILLHDVEELPNEEVAAALGLTVAAVKSRVHRARLLLPQKLTHFFSLAG